MYRRMNPKQLEKEIEDLKKWREEKEMKVNIPLLEGYSSDGPVFGQKTVSEQELKELTEGTTLDRP